MLICLSLLTHIYSILNSTKLTPVQTINTLFASKQLNIMDYCVKSLLMTFFSPLIVLYKYFHKNP